MKTIYNALTVDLQLTRADLCDLEIACALTGDASGAEKWDALREKIDRIIEAFDADHLGSFSASLEA